MKRKYQIDLQVSLSKRVVNNPSIIVPQTTKHQNRIKRPTDSSRHLTLIAQEVSKEQKSIKQSPKPQNSSSSKVIHKRILSDTSASKHSSHLNLKMRSYADKKSVDKPPQQEPMTPAVAIKALGPGLSSFEQSEILNFKQVFYAGINSFKIRKNQSELNFGYDDEKGNYRIINGDHIAYRYEILCLLGSGSFGRVVKALDHKTQKEVALKVIKNRYRFHEQAAVEIKILKFLKEINAFNVVNMLDCFAFRNHVCIAFELLNMSLYDFIKGNEFHGLSQRLIRRMAVQILQTLKVQALHKIVHCDLKPENIMLVKPNQSTIKVIDYGSSCFEKEKIYTYIQSRFYRAPEIILGVEYTTQIDMWSFGCILAELFIGRPLFSGECEAEQLLCMMEILGLPPKELMARATRSRFFFNGERPILYTNRRGEKRMPSTKALTTVLYGADPLLIDLIKQCLRWDPNKRISPSDAIAHPWIQCSRKEHTRKSSVQLQQKVTTGYHSQKPSLDEELSELMQKQSFLFQNIQKKFFK